LPSLLFYVSKVIKKIQISSCKNSTLSQKARVGSSNTIYDSSISDYSYVGNDCTIVNTNIGKFCSIANNVIIGGAKHPMELLSTSPVFYTKQNVFRKCFDSVDFHETEVTRICHDVWVGNYALIKSGVTVNVGSIIGMGSVVTKDIPAYEVWAGNPAKKIRNRFDSVTKEKLLESEWWNQNEKEISHYSREFRLL
jgi:acetyltransferase-like isoleucine patch superfamily enzyme